MKVSTKGHYGLRSLVDIARHQVLGPVALSDIARRQDISVKYLWQVVNPLRTSGVLKVTRGTKGGYALARAPETINMLDVWTTLEGPVAILRCLTDEVACARSGTCPARTVWDDVNQAIRQSLEKITLAQVLSQCHEEAPTAR